VRHIWSFLRFKSLSSLAKPQMLRMFSEQMETYYFCFFISHMCNTSCLWTETLAYICSMSRTFTKMTDPLDRPIMRKSSSGIILSGSSQSESESKPKFDSPSVESTTFSNFRARARSLWTDFLGSAAP
jgi:hypothetical protein